MAAVGNHTEPTLNLAFPVPSLGNGFVEITALTTLVGSAVTESLILGNEGGAGVAWAAMSAFGLLRVVTACIGAASVGWLRSVMGARSEISDLAIGMDVVHNARGRGAMKIRRSYGERGPLGISVDAAEYMKVRGTEAASKFKISWKEIYAFDRATSRGLGGIPDPKTTFKPKDLPDKQTYAPHQDQLGLGRRNVAKTADRPIDVSPVVYSYTKDPFHPHHDPWFQIPALLLTLLKVGEGAVLWKVGNGFLGIVTIVPWAYFFLVACIVEAREMIVAHKPEVLDGEIDILTGQLPNMAQSTDSRCRIIIGAPRNSKKLIWWKLAWGLGAIICTPVIVFTYLSLGQQTNDIVILWAAFQTLWMVGRMLVHHYAESPREAAAARILYQQPWETLPDSMKERAVNLIVALTGYVTSVHPRQEWAYRDNTIAAKELRGIIIDTPTFSHYPVPEDAGFPAPSSFNGGQVKIDIHAVIGDPTLVSAAWVASVPGLTFESLYDTCILSFRLPPNPGTPNRHPCVTVPCVRFLTALAASDDPAFDEETNQPLGSLPQFYPKGLPNNGSRNAWWYFIPLATANPSWLVAKQDVLSPVLGKHSAEVMSDDRVTALLSRGTLGVSLSHADEVRHALQQSEKARYNLAKLLS